MNGKFLPMVIVISMLPLAVLAAPSLPMRQSELALPQSSAEPDRKVTAGRILLKWGSYVEKVKGQSRRDWAVALWPSLASASLENLQRALQAVTYEGMRNALLGQRPFDDQIIDGMARAKSSGSNPVTSALGSLAADLVFTPVTPCRIVDTRVGGVRIAANASRDLDASHAGGSFITQGGSDTDCGIPANPAALALSVTGLNNTTTGYIRVYPYDGTSAQGSPVPLNTINTTATNDIIVPACQGCTQELKVFSTANTHYAAFVTGYFMAPQATRLECRRKSADFQQMTATPGVVGANTPACDTGYAPVSGGCIVDAGLQYLGAEPSYGVIASWTCYVGNSDGIAGLYYQAYTACCRMPGR